MFVSRNALLILGTVLCVLLYVSTSSIRLLLHHELDSKGSSLRSVRDQKENVSARDSQPERVSHSEKYVESLCAGKSNLQAGAFPSQQEKVVARTSRDLDGWLWDDELDSERKFRMKTPVSSSNSTLGHSSLEIDFVFKWVDGSRLPHSQRKVYWERVLSDKLRMGPSGMECPAIDIQQNSVRRERDNLELLFALRSLHMYAPWFRHIFIVVEGPHMIPNWLLMDHPRLSIIFHSDIFPEPQAEYLPTFNGHAVGSVLHRIPCLSENYIAMDDDYFFTAKVVPENFFHIVSGQIVGPTAVQEGREVVPRSQKECYGAHHHDAINMNSAFMMSTITDTLKVSPEVGLKEFRRMLHEPYASSVSAHQHILEDLFPNETAALRAHRFRTKSDFHVEALAFNIALNSNILQLDGQVAMGRASTLKCAFTAFTVGDADTVCKRLKRIASEKQFMGINDDMGEVSFDRDVMTSFYTELWPKAAPWENTSAVAAVVISKYMPN